MADRTEIQKLRIENVNLKDAYETLLDKLESSKRHRAEIDNEKTSVVDQMLHAEQDKLMTSKKLIELQIEITHLSEQMETEKFELGNQLVTLGRDLEDAESKSAKSMKSNEYLRHNFKVAEEELRDLREEKGMLKINYDKVVNAYEEELHYNDEVCAQLLTLADAKLELQRQLELIGGAGKVFNDLDLNQVRFLTSRHQNIPKITDSFDTYKAKNKMLPVVKYKSDEIEEINTTPLKNKAIDSLNSDLFNTRRIVKQQITEIANLNSELIIMKEEKSSHELSKNRLQHKLKSTNEDCKDKVIACLNETMVACRHTIDGAKIKEYVDDQLSRVKDAHKNREYQLSEALEQQSKDMNANNNKYKRLISEHRREEKFDTSSHNTNDSLQNLRKELKEFTLNTQAGLEKDRASLMSKNAMLERENEQLNEYLAKINDDHKTELTVIRNRVYRDQISQSPRVYKI